MGRRETMSPAGYNKMAPAYNPLGAKSRFLACLALLILAGCIGFAANVLSLKVALLVCVLPLAAYLFLTRTEQMFYVFVLFVPIQCVLFPIFVTKHAARTGSTFSWLGASKDAFLLLLVLAFLVNFLVGRIKLRRDSTIPLIVMFVLVCFSYVFCSPNLKAASLEFRNLTEFSLVYFLVVGVLDRPEKAARAIKCFLVAGFFVVIYAIYVLLGSVIGYGYEFGVMPEQIVGRLTVFGDELSPGGFSTYLTLVATIALSLLVVSRKESLGRWAGATLLMLFLLSVVCIVFTFSRRAYLAMVVIFIILMLISTRRTKTILIVAGAIAATAIVVGLVFPHTVRILYDRISIIDPNYVTNIGRITEFSNLFARASRHFFLGEGIGVSGSAGITFPFPEFSFSHNFYVAILLQVGLIGLLLFVAVIGVILWRGLGPRSLRSRPPSHKYLLLGSSLCVFALALQSVFSTTIGVYPFSFYFWFFAGIVTVAYREAMRDKERERT